MNTSVTFGDDAAAALAGETAAKLAAEGVPAALAAGDPTLWGPDAESEAAIRLGWLNLPKSSRELLPRLGELAAEIRERGLDHVVLAGMGRGWAAPRSPPR